MELIPIPLASTQHNLYDIYLLLCIQHQTQIRMELILIPLASTQRNLCDIPIAVYTAPDSDQDGTHPDPASKHSA